jgi:tRNA modification GTPase
MHDRDTIAAIATAAGRGGIGVVRLSGPQAREIAEAICRRALRPRHAHHVRFRDRDGETLDDGLALWFRAPASYTGEDVVELQAHGSPVVLDALLENCCTHGARRARAGEFSERAWENGRLDLAQAEAVADLIAAGDLRAARAARRSLEGEFSQRVDALARTLLSLRVQLEASIDFSDEELDADGEAALRRRLQDARAQLEALLAATERGRRLRDGLHAVIVGPPNAGKSSLLNALAGSDRAIVTDLPGTTRDLLHETIRVDGVELTLVDTAGLREEGDAIEREGMRRARGELARADAALVVLDARDPESGRLAVEGAIAGVPEIVWLHNKCDLLAAMPATGDDAIPVSARTGAGLEALHQRLRALAGGGGEGAFSARARHVQALRRAGGLLDEAMAGFAAARPELAADSLRRAHDALGEITGRVLPDALLGHIFATFCIGK